LGNYEYKEFSKIDLEDSIIHLTNGTQYVSIDNLNIKVKSIYIELSGIEENEIVEYDLFYSDDSTTTRYLASKDYCQDVEKTKYSTVSLSGDCKSVAINVKNDKAKIETIGINKLVPFEFNFARAAILIAIAMIICSFKTAEFWNLSYSQNNLKQELVLLGIVAIGLFSIFFINDGCAIKYKEDDPKRDLYCENLVKALAKGEVELADTPDTSKLDELENPYDTVERGKLDRKVDYLWDAAYYNHKYYSYFGALPAVLLMVPYYLITNKLMLTSIATLIFSLVSVPMLVLLVKKVFQKYFKELQFKFLALSTLIMIFGTTLIWINVAPRFYELVTVACFFFVITGFTLVFDSEREDRKISYLKLFFGSLSLALSVACRPTGVFASLLIVPILWKYLKKAIDRAEVNQEQEDVKNGKWKNILKLFICIAIPYTIVAAILMRYNYVRFGNVFEFGEKYQLTINNMQELDLRWSLLPTGILCNLFGLPVFQGFFPFIQANGNLIDTFGYYYIEDMVGGVFFLAPIAFFCFGIFKVFKKSENKDFKIFITSLLTVGLIYAIFISLKAGSTGRYLLDFAWLFVLCGICIFMEILKNLKTEEGKKILEKVLYIIVCYTLIINILSSFCIIGGVNSMKHNSPKQYFDAEYTVMILK